MKNYRQAAMSIAFLTVIISAGIFKDYLEVIDMKKGGESRERQEEMLRTFENNDYQSWQNIVKMKSNLARVVTEKDFEKFVIARKAARAGNYNKSIQLSRELGEELKTKIPNFIIG